MNQEPSKPTSSWRRRILRGAPFVLVCIITLVAIFYAEEDLRGKWAWEKYKREIESTGERLDIASVIPPPVPDDQNFAMTPLLRPIMEFVRGSNGVRWLDTNALAHVQAIQYDSQPKGRTNKFSLGGTLDKGTFIDLESCRAFYSGNTNYPQPVTPGTAAADILVALGKFDADFKQLHEAARTRPQSRFPIEYTYEHPFAILLPHLATVKKLCSVLGLSAVAKLDAGNIDGAFSDLKLGMRLSDSIRDEPLLIDDLVRIGTLMLNLQTLREGLARHSWSDDQLQQIENYLGSLNLLAEGKNAMRGERNYSIQTLDDYRRAGWKARPDELFESGGSSPLISFLPAGWYHQNMRTLAWLQQSFTLAAVNPEQHRVYPETIEKADQYLKQESTTPYNFFSKLLFPGATACTKKNARAQAFTDSARAACALERYRIANGRLPDSLAALTPQFIGKMPNDVIDGQPLRYHTLAAGGYVVYSIGWNQKDDGGVPGLKEYSTSVNIAKGDWVWQMPK
jgi:hypothetical protein